MNRQIVLMTMALMGLTFGSCADGTIALTEENLEVINREIMVADTAENSVSLNDKPSDGLAIIKNINFDGGTIAIDIKGEDVQGKSFVGVAFNIVNDSTYEAVYFRPFNFRSNEQIRREHSVQYIYHPKNSWRYLRTNFEGQYEAEFPRQPHPDDWFSVQIKVDSKNVYVYDTETNTELLIVERLATQTSDKLGLWTGFNSKGAFKNLKIIR